MKLASTFVLLSLFSTQPALADYFDLARAEQQNQKATAEAAESASRASFRESYNRELYSVAGSFAAKHGGLAAQPTAAITPNYGGSDQIQGLISHLTFSTGDGNECAVTHDYDRNMGTSSRLALHCINARTGQHTDLFPGSGRR